MGKSYSHFDICRKSNIPANDRFSEILTDKHGKAADILQYHGQNSIIFTNRQCFIEK